MSNTFFQGGEKVCRGFRPLLLPWLRLDGSQLLIAQNLNQKCTIRQLLYFRCRCTSSKLCLTKRSVILQNCHIYFRTLYLADTCVTVFDWASIMIFVWILWRILFNDMRAYQTKNIVHTTICGVHWVHCDIQGQKYFERANGFFSW